MQNLWVTGYRNYELNIYNDQDLKLKVIKTALQQTLIDHLNQGMTWLITGGQLGTEQWALAVAHQLKTDYPELKSAAMLPFAEFGQQWNENNRSKLAQALTWADFSEPITKQPYQSGRQLRTYQQFMLTHTDKAVLLYDPEYPGKPSYDYKAILKYQETHDYDLTLIDMYDLESISQDLQENLS